MVTVLLSVKRVRLPPADRYCGQIVTSNSGRRQKSIVTPRLWAFDILSQNAIRKNTTGSNLTILISVYHHFMIPLAASLAESIAKIPVGN